MLRSEVVAYFVFLPGQFGTSFQVKEKSIKKQLKFISCSPQTFKQLLHAAWSRFLVTIVLRVFVPCSKKTDAAQSTHAAAAAAAKDRLVHPPEQTSASYQQFR